MPDYTPPPLVYPGQGLPAATWNTTIKDSMEALAKPSRCRVRRTTAQSIPTAANAPVSFQVEDYDIDSCFDVATPTRLIAPKTGLYEVHFGAQFAINAAGVRLWAISGVGGVASGLVSAIGHGIGNASWYVGGTVTTEIVLNAAQYVECFVFQNSGVALNLDIGYPVWASMRLVAR